MTRAPAWITPLLMVAYLATSNVAMARQTPLLAAAATLLLVLLILAALSRWPWAQLALGLAGAWLVLAVFRGAVPPVPLLLPPVAIPAALAWMFGQTLLAHRVPLVEQFARAVHAPEPLDAAHIAYARGVNVMWTAALLAMSLGNLVLVSFVSPGGLLNQLGIDAPWHIEVDTFLWLSNGVYLLIAAIFVVEFLLRRVFLPGYRFRDPIEFMRRARARLPQVLEAQRRD